RWCRGSRRDLRHRAAGPGSRQVLAEDPALDLAPVVLQRVVQVDEGGLRRSVRLTVTDGAVDGLVFLDGLGGVPANALDADDACLPLEPPGLAHCGDKKQVVRRRCHAEVKVVVTLLEAGVV